MLNAIKAWIATGYRRWSPFYRNPIQTLPSAWSTEAINTVLPNPHLAHEIITHLIRHNPHVAECLREMDGEYLLQASAEEHSISQGTLWVNLFRLGSTLAVVGDAAPEHVIAPVDAKRVCAEGWARTGIYQFFINVSQCGRRTKATIKAIKDERKYAAQYNPHDPVQSWAIPLEDPAMTALGFGK